jgi:hypothetical protein
MLAVDEADGGQKGDQENDDGNQSAERDKIQIRKTPKWTRGGLLCHTPTLPRMRDAQQLQDFRHAALEIVKELSQPGDGLDRIALR